MPNTDFVNSLFREFNLVNRDCYDKKPKIVSDLIKGNKNLQSFSE
jgi:hypothetical protein